MSSHSRKRRSASKSRGSPSQDDSAALVVLPEDPSKSLGILTTMPLYRKVFTLLTATMQVENTQDARKDAYLKKLEVRVKNLTIWVDPDVPETKLLTAVATTPFVDPRGPLDAKCIYIGAAKAGMQPMEIMSLCIPGTDCARFLCFYVPELASHLGTGSHKNIWAKEIRTKLTEIGLLEYVKLVDDDMPSDWEEAILTYADALKLHTNEIRSTIDVIIFNKAVAMLSDYFTVNPESITIGTVFSRIKGAIPQWLKSLVASPAKLLYYILNNSFTVNLCVLISKGLRALVCGYTSGITISELKVFLMTMWEDVKNNPVVGMLISVLIVMYECIVKTFVNFTSLNFVGLAKSLLTCIQTAITEFGIKAQLLQLNFLKNFILYVIRKMLSFIVGNNAAGTAMILIELVVDGVTDPIRLYKALFGNAKEAKDAMVELQMKGVTRSHFFANINLTVFWAVIAVMPSSALDWLMAIVLPLLPAGGYVEKAKDLLMKAYNALVEAVGVANLNAAGIPVKVTIGDVLIYAARFAGAAQSIYMIFYEVYGWTVDIFGCFLAKFTGKLKRLAGYDPIASDTSAACCFKDLVQDLQKAVTPPSFTGVFHSSKEKLKAAVTSALSFFSDARLKILLKRVFSIDVHGKTIHFWLFKWRPEVIGSMRGTDAYLHIGLVAQEVQRDFPKAVGTHSDGLLYVKINELPCNIHVLYAALNNLSVPKCRKTRLRIRSS